MYTKPNRHCATTMVWYNTILLYQTIIVAQLTDS